MRHVTAFNITLTLSFSVTSLRKAFRLPTILALIASLGVALLALGSAATCEAQQSLLSENRVTLGLKTLGGRLEWTDQLVWSGWRIQANAIDGRCRLLDSKNRRHAVGTFDFCMEQLLVQRSQIGSSIPKHVVVLLHGLAGNRNYMERMENYLTENGFEVVSFGYASTKGTIQELATSLECVVRNLQDVQQVSFVAHSMGNILVRNMLYRLQSSENPPANLQFCRMVMISPPNQGAFLADTLGQRKLIQSVFGPAVDQFAPSGGWPALEQELATPWFEFGIIAGGTGNDRGYLARVPGDDDGLLSIDSHHLDGASDFIQLGGFHQLMPHYKSVQEATVCFLKNGHFRR